MENHIILTILAWLLFVDGIFSFFIHPFLVGRVRSKQEATYAQFGCVFISVFAGIYIFT